MDLAKHGLAKRGLAKRGLAQHENEDGQKWIG